MKVTNRIKNLWATGTRQATSLAGTRSSEGEQQTGWADWLGQRLADRPALTLGVGLALGVTIGWLIKRR
jgi:hypothetical protein